MNSNTLFLPTATGVLRGIGVWFTTAPKSAPLRASSTSSWNKKRPRGEVQFQDRVGRFVAHQPIGHPEGNLVHDATRVDAQVLIAPPPEVLEAIGDPLFNDLYTPW